MVDGFGAVAGIFFVGENTQQRRLKSFILPWLAHLPGQQVMLLMKRLHLLTLSER